MVLLFSMMIAAVFVFGAFHFWKQLPEGKNGSPQHLFRNWVIKGAALPIFLWIFINAGLSSKLPPLLPRVEMTPPGVPRFLALLDVAGIGFLVVGSYWGMVTFGWLLARISYLTEDRREFLIFSSVCSLVLLPIALLTVYCFGWGFAGFAGTLWLAPIVLGTLDKVVILKVLPTYSRAIAAMQFDKYDEAEAAVIMELEKCEEDFDGWMMLAELYATRFNDLAGAERTVRESCNQPNATVSQVSVAFHRLADWHLKWGENPDAARRALQEICQRFPDTHLERMAQSRINQLPSSRDELIEQRKTKTFHLPALSNDLALPATGSGTDAAGHAPAEAAANRCVAKLTQDPNNISAREELARIFVERLNQIEMGMEQLELLLAMPEQPENKTAEWLGLTAAWQMRYLQDETAARKTLERLLLEFPQSAQAFAAQKRLSLMDEGAKIRQARAKLSSR